MDSSVARFMIENCGSDINTLMRELEKVCCFADDSVITREQVDLVCVKSIDASVYEYAKMIINRNTLESINILNDLFYMRVEPIVILYTAASAFIDIARVSAANKARKTNADVAKDFAYGKKTFVIERASKNARRFNSRTLLLCLNEILNADRLIKSYSQNEKCILEEMTVKLIHIIANGDSIDKT